MAPDLAEERVNIEMSRAQRRALEPEIVIRVKMVKRRVRWQLVYRGRDEGLFRREYDARGAAIVLILQDHGMHRAHEFAAMFGVTERTVLRDIAKMRAKGWRIDGEAGVGFILRRTQPHHVLGA